MISKDVTFLEKSFEDWENVKDPAIVPLTTDMIDTIDENNELDAPNLVPPDHGPDDKSMIHDDYTRQGDDLQIPVPSILKHGIYVTDVEHSNDEDSNDEDSDDNSLQEAAIQVDPEGYNSATDENEVNEQPRSETTVNSKVLRAMKNLEALFILKL